MIFFRFLRFLREVFPDGKAEWALCLIFLGIFGVLDYFLAFNYRIIFDHRIPWDAYFSFDNRSIVMTGGGFERHPLANYFFDGLRNLALEVSGQRYNGTFRLVLALCSSLALTLALLYLFKYCRTVVRLTFSESWLITLFFGSFSTVWMLFFTPETYTYTLPALIFFVYYASVKFQKRESPGWAATVLANILIGGLTVTNSVKVYLPQLFFAQNWKTWRTFGQLVLKTGASVAVFVLLFLWRMDFQWQEIIKQTGSQYEKFSQAKGAPFWDMVISWFWGSPMLAPGFIVKDYHSKDGFPYKALFFDTYQNFLAYAGVALILLLVLAAVFFNRKNRLVWMLVSFFAVDFLIHVVLKFGLKSAYIYGGHYIFLVPLLLAWLLASFKNIPPVRFAILALMVLLTGGLLFQNGHQALEFRQFLEKYYRV